MSLFCYRPKTCYWLNCDENLDFGYFQRFMLLTHTTLNISVGDGSLRIFDAAIGVVGQLCQQSDRLGPRCR